MVGRLLFFSLGMLHLQGANSSFLGGAVFFFKDHRQILAVLGSFVVESQVLP